MAYNPGIVAAFQSAYGGRIHVSPCFLISGAYGAALLALEEVGADQNTPPKKASRFTGLIPQDTVISGTHLNEETRRNINFYSQTRQLLLSDYDPTIDARKKTVGIPTVLILHKFFPLANAVFKDLGFNVVLSDYTNEDIVHLSQQSAQGETCCPVKLIYGHMMQLVEKQVDYIFLPSIHTMTHEHSEAAHCYGCVYMQTAARSIASTLKLEEKGIRLLSPVFDLDIGKPAMISAMLGVGKQLGFIKPRTMKALLGGAGAVRQFDHSVEQLGDELLQSLQPADKVLVLITRNYGVNDPVLNMGIPELLLERGYKVITLSHLPGHGIDIAADYPNMDWAFGEHILSGAKLIAHHPNLYAVYLANHGCGLDSLMSHRFRQEMGEKPYLQIEVDKHFSKVGVVTRVEAFLNSLSHRPAQKLPAHFDLKAVSKNPPAMTETPKSDEPLYLPDLGCYTPYLAAFFRKIYAVDTVCINPVDRQCLSLGRAETSTKECLPFPALLGGPLRVLEQRKTAQFLIPSTLGAEADGQYARAIRAILDRRGFRSAHLVAPSLELLPKTADLDLLFRAVLTGDLLYAAASDARDLLAPHEILPAHDLIDLGTQIGASGRPGWKLAVVGTPLCQTVLHDGVLDTPEAEGEHFYRARCLNIYGFSGMIALTITVPPPSLDRCLRGWARYQTHWGITAPSLRIRMGC